MKVNVSGILKSINSSIDICGNVDIPSIKYGDEDIPVNSPVKVEGSISNTGEHLLIKGKIIADLTLRCSRCLEDSSYVLETEFDEELSNKNKGGDVVYFAGDTIDITDIVVNNILLSLPMKFVCSEDCRGICPQCGTNKNIKECSCKTESLDPRLSVLKDLLKDN